MKLPKKITGIFLIFALLTSCAAATENKDLPTKEEITDFIAGIPVSDNYIITVFNTVEDKQLAWNCDIWKDKNGNQILSLYYVDPDSANGYGIIYFDKSGEEISTRGVEIVPVPVKHYVGKAVSEGSKGELMTSSPAPHTSLRTISSPEGADIFLDGKYVGVTPKNIPINDLETHSIRLELNGYENWEEECTFDQLDTKEIVVSLNKTQPATVMQDDHQMCSPTPHISLRTISSPEGADIFLDGKYVGVTPKNIPINDLGTHSIRLELNGYENWEEECTFDQLDTNEIVASLHKTQSVAVMPVNTTMPNFLGLSALITILSAYFIMKKNE